MATDLQRFHRPLRALLGRRFGDLLTDENLTDGLVLVLRAGRVPGHAVDASDRRVTPSLNPPADGTPLAYVQLLYHTVLVLISPDAAGNAFDSRAYKERLGDAWKFVESLRREIWLAETGGGTVLTSWQSAGGLFSGLAGWEDLWSARAEVTVDSAFPGLHLGPTGATPA